MVPLRELTQATDAVATQGGAYGSSMVTAGYPAGQGRCEKYETTILTGTIEPHQFNESISLGLCWPNIMHMIH